MRIKKAILTGGGRATRLYPVTTTINKHLLPLANKPMIFHAIEKVIEAGVEEIFINVNPGETELQKYIGDGGHWGISIRFFEQTGGPQGIAHVVNEAKEFIGNDPFIFYLSDNIVLGSVKDMVTEFTNNNYDCMLALSKVPDPQRFGVPVFCSKGNLIDVVEKPAIPPSDFAVTGIYIYGPKIFFETFEKIEKSDRGEYEISSIHSHFLKNKKKVGYKEITGWWKDTGLASDLLMANKLLLEKRVKDDFGLNVALPDDCKIEGDKVQIGIGTLIKQNVKVISPVVIGENCLLENCEIGPNVSISSGTEIKNAKIKDSIILDNALISADILITDSLIGRSARLRKKDQHEAQGHRMVIGDKTIIEI